MFDTNVTIVGNVLTAPEWRRTTQSGTLVANFKVASTARRLDRESGRWVDGNSLRVRVNCWRKLAEGVASSVMTGDPVIVVGRLYTRDWIDDAGNHRTLYELEAVAVGHDLSRGRGQFARNRATMTTSSVEDAEAEHRVHGEATEPVPSPEAPTSHEPRPFDDEPGFSAVRLSTDAGFVSVDDDPSGDPVDDDSSGDPVDDDLPGGPVDDEPSGGDADPVASPGDDRRIDEDPAPGGDPGAGGPGADGGAEPWAEAGVDNSPAGRGRRGRGRVPVPA
jgi:single-strand DNA-binding protein